MADTITPQEIAEARALCEKLSPGLCEALADPGVLVRAIALMRRFVDALEAERERCAGIADVRAESFRRQIAAGHQANQASSGKYTQGPVSRSTLSRLASRAEEAAAIAKAIRSGHAPGKGEWR